MAAVSGPKTPIAKPKPHQIPGALTRHVILDPGMAYIAADAMMFWGTNPVGMVAMAGAVGIAGALKAITVLQPKFAEKYPKVMQLAQDDRVPLRAGGLAMLLVTGATIATGAWLPAAASFFFAVANFGLAESASKRHIEQDRELAKPHAPLTLAQKATTLFKRPDIYLNIGFGLAGLMTGGAAMAILPLVGAAFVMGTRNTFAGKPEYAGHPKLITGAAAALFAGIGFMNGHGLIAAAHLVNALVLGEMERRMTPGGFKQIMKDIGGGIAGVFGRKPKAAPEAPRIDVPEPAPVAPYAFSEPQQSLQETFGIRSVPVNTDKPVLVRKPAPAISPGLIPEAA